MSAGGITIAEVRDDMASAIKTGTGLRTLPYLSSNIPHPCAFVRAGGYDPRMVLSKAKSEYRFIVTVFVGPTAETAAQKRCDRLREVTAALTDDAGVGLTDDEEAALLLADQGYSIVQAVEDDSLWTQAIDYAAVTFVGEIGEIVVAEETLLTFDVDVEVVF